MNYIGCFNRFRAANCLQPVFFRSWCALMLPGVEYCRRAPFAPSWRLDAARRGRIAAVSFAPFWCASMLPGVEYCRRALCAFLAPRCCQAWTYCRRALCAFLVPQCCQVWSVAPLRRSWCLDAARCGVFHRCAVPGAPQWCPLCYVIHIIVYHRF